MINIFPQREILLRNRSAHLVFKMLPFKERGYKCLMSTFCLEFLVSAVAHVSAATVMLLCTAGRVPFHPLPGRMKDWRPKAFNSSLKEVLSPACLSLRVIRKVRGDVSESVD